MNFQRFALKMQKNIKMRVVFILQNGDLTRKHENIYVWVVGQFTQETPIFVGEDQSLLHFYVIFPYLSCIVFHSPIHQILMY